jgi:succinoglycan biosynthesis transport protein ExoP
MSNQDQPPMALPPYPPSVPPASPPPPPLMDYGYGMEMHQGRDLREYLHILLKRKWWVIGTFLAIFLVVALLTFMRTPIYRAETTLQITQDNPGSQVTPDSNVSNLFWDSAEKFQQTQYEILQSRSLALGVIKALNLGEYGDFKAIRKENPEKSQTEIDNAMVNLFLGKLEVTPVKNSFLVHVSYQSPDKVMAQRVVNAIADQYMYLSIDRRKQSFILVRKWLDHQLQALAGKVQVAQKQLYKFGQKTGIYTLGDKDNVIVQKYIDLSALLTKAQAEQMAKKAQYQQIKAKGLDAPSIVNNPTIAALRQQLVAEQAKVSAMRKIYRSGHPDLQAEEANLAELRSRLRAEVQRIKESVKADYEAASRTEKLLSDSFSAQKGQMKQLQDNLTNYQILKRNAQTNEQLYQALLSRVKEASISSTMVPSNVTVIDPGQLPSVPYKPKKVRDLALAGFLGLTLGIGLALLAEHLDDSIKSQTDLEQVCNLPSLGLVPLQDGNGRKTLSQRRQRSKSISSELWRSLSLLHREVDEKDVGIAVSTHPHSYLSEAIHQVYSSLILSTSGRPPGAIVVTSPSPNEGKTTMASNLAQSFALNGRQVVLVDCDLRKPKVHQIFQVQAQPGLSNYLTGGATLEEILRTTPIPNLTVITAGARPPSPANLLNSETFKELITELRQQFHHIIIDTPPVLTFADARFISALVDGVVLVTKCHVTAKGAGSLARQLLSQAPILGAVLNGVGPYGQSYGGYYYHYHYKYYSKYYDDKGIRN